MHHDGFLTCKANASSVFGQVTEASGIDMIEAVERTDKTFVLGIQFHPEIAVVRKLDESSLCYFTAIVEAAK